MVGRGAQCVVGIVVGLRREREAPASCLMSNQDLFIVVGLKAGGRKHAAVVGAAGARAMLVDRAAIVDQHRALAAFVVTHEHVSAWQARSGKQQR